MRALIWLPFIIFCLTACGNLPLVRPETSASQTAITDTSIATVEISGKTSTPSPTQEPTKENLTSASSVTVGGYTFSSPQEVPDGRGAVEIIGWLSNDEIIDAYARQIITINMYTGQVREFSDKFERHLVWPAIWPLPNDRIAFVPDMGQADGVEVWISGANSERATKPAITDVYPFPILDSSGKGLIVYKANTKQASLLRSDGTTQPAKVAALDVLRSKESSITTQTEEHSTLNLLSASSPASRWTVVYNEDRFSLIDLKTSEVRPIDLKTGEVRASDIGYSARAAYWSPDGQRLAILVTEGPDPISFMKVFVLDVESGQIREIVTDFQYITNVTWAPDNQYLLAMVKTGEVDGYSTHGLVLININSNRIDTVPILPIEALGDFIWGLNWSQDGKKIAIAYSDGPGNYQLYRIDVKLP